MVIDTQEHFGSICGPIVALVPHGVNEYVLVRPSSLIEAPE